MSAQRSSWQVLQRLLVDLWPLRWRVLFASLLVFLCVGSSVGLMATSGFLIALAASHPPVAALSVGVVGVRFFGLARGALRYTERLMSHATGFRVLGRWRLRFYSRLEPLAPYGLGDQSSGELLVRLGHDVDKLEALYTRVISPLLAAFWVAVLMGIFLGQYAWHYAAWFMLCYTASAAVPLLCRRRIRVAAQKNAQARGALSGFAQQMVLGHAEIRVLGLESHMLRGAENLGLSQDDASRRSQRALQGAEAWAGLFPGLAILGVLVLGAQDWSQGLLLPTQWVGILLGVLAAFEATQGFATLAAQLEESLASGGRLLAVVDRVPPVTEPSSEATPRRAGAPALSARGVRFAFPGRPELFCLDFALGAGEVLLLQGPSGSGKSTLAALLARFLEYEGSVELFGRELRSLPGEAVRRELCLLDQEVHLFTGTLAENLRIAAPVAPAEELCEVLSAVGLGAWLAALPAGLDTWLGERGQALSGGERQRIAAARALLCKAPLVVADEPAAHLHAAAERELLEAFRKAPHQPALLWISHRLEDQTEFPTLSIARI